MPEAARGIKPKESEFSRPGMRPAGEPGLFRVCFGIACRRRFVRESTNMETILTIMGWVSVAILAWFIYGFVRNIVRGLQRPKSRTDNVNKDMY
jgi:hypothetical protein